MIARKTSLNLCNLLIKSHLLYGLITWGSIDPCTTQQPSQPLQNNVIRAITGISRFEHITPSFRQLDFLKIHDLCKIEIVLNVNTVNPRLSRGIRS